MDEEIALINSKGSYKSQEMNFQFNLKYLAYKLTYPPSQNWTDYEEGKIKNKIMINRGYGSINWM